MSDCYKQILRALADIGKHYDDTLEPVRRAPGSHVKASKEPPLPISAHVLDVRAMTCSRLAGWSLMVIDERDLHTEHLSGTDVRAMCDLLRRHADWLSEHEAAADVVAELEGSARDLTGIAAPHRKDWMSLGICPLFVERDGEPVGCTGTIRAYPDCDPYCDGCGTKAVVTWWERMQFPDAELSRLLTAPELVLFVHKQFGRVIVEATIRQWVRQNVIAKAGTDDKGRSLYDKASVAYALERRRVLA